MTPEGILADHRLSDRPSMSWHMAKLGTTHYAYSVTWTPGTLIVAGDIGDFTLNHWQAMKTLPSTLDWLSDIHFTYMMEKSTAKQEYEPEKTAKFIIECANEDAIHSVQALRDDWREYRAIRREDPDYDDKPLPLAFHGSTPPDGWRTWHNIRSEVEPFGDPAMIFKPEGRWSIKKRMEERLVTPEAAADFCYAIGLDDYYGSYDYPHQCRLYFAAIKRWRDAVAAAMGVPA